MINAELTHCTNVYYLVCWPHCMRRWRGLLLQVMSRVPWSVCLRGCLLAKPRLLQKRLNPSRYRLKGQELLLKGGAHWCHLASTIERYAASMRPYVKFVWPLGSLLSHSVPPKFSPSRWPRLSAGAVSVVSNDSPRRSHYDVTTNMAAQPRIFNREYNK